MNKQKKQTKTKKLKISEKAIIKKGKSAMSGCGKSFDNDCGISARTG
jgi:hypothetical protein